MAEQLLDRHRRRGERRRRRQALRRPVGTAACSTAGWSTRRTPTSSTGLHAAGLAAAAVPLYMTDHDATAAMAAAAIELVLVTLDASWRRTASPRSGPATTWRRWSSPHCPPVDGDVVLVTSKVVSKAEGRVAPGTDRIAAVEAELAEPGARVVARRGPTTIVRTRLGLTLAAAGVDALQRRAGHACCSCPLDPDGSARALRRAVAERTGANVGVVVTDTAGRAWRTGQTDIAIGAAGLTVLDDHSGPHRRATATSSRSPRPRSPTSWPAPPSWPRASSRGRPFAWSAAGPTWCCRPARTVRVPRRWSGPRARTCSGTAPARPWCGRWPASRPTGRRSVPRRAPTEIGGAAGAGPRRRGRAGRGRSGGPADPGWRRWRSRTAGTGSPPKKVLRKVIRPVTP